MSWIDYMEMAAKHSRGSAKHWFRYLRKDIDKCGILFSKQDLEALYQKDVLTPFQRVTLKAAFEDGTATRQHIMDLNRTVNRNKIMEVRRRHEHNK